MDDGRPDTDTALYRPVCFSLRRLTMANASGIQISAAMGTVVSLEFATFGLTELTFWSMQNVSLYVTLLA